jgi:hypothetical protein
VGLPACRPAGGGVVVLSRRMVHYGESAVKTASQGNGMGCLFFFIRFVRGQLGSCRRCSSRHSEHRPHMFKSIAITSMPLPASGLLEGPPKKESTDPPVH